METIKKDGINAIFYIPNETETKGYYLITKKDKLYKFLPEKDGNNNGVWAIEVSPELQQEINQLFPTLLKNDPSFLNSGVPKNGSSLLNSGVSKNGPLSQNPGAPKNNPWKWVIIIGGVILTILIIAGLIYHVINKKSLQNRKPKLPKSKSNIGKKSNINNIKNL